VDLAGLHLQVHTPEDFGAVLGDLCVKVRDLEQRIGHALSGQGPRWAVGSRLKRLPGIVPRKR